MKRDDPVKMELILDGIQKKFGEKEVLRGVSFPFEQGKIYGLLGRNGAGKTTLFNCLSNEISMDAGTAQLKDVSGTLRALTPEDIGYVFSTPILPDFLTGREFLKFFMEINRDKIRSDQTIDDYFDLVKIDREDRDRLIKGYSHGMKNKVQMLCFMIARPPVILLDEPLTSFDVVVALEIKQLIREISAEHIIIFSTHILQLATDLCDEIVILSDGTLEQLDHAMLESGNFEVQIIEKLKDEDAHE